MFTRTEALEFAYERGLKGANFCYHNRGKITVWYWEGNTTLLHRGSCFMVSKEDWLAKVLQGRGDGWFVSANVGGGWWSNDWSYFFSNGDEVPHD